MNKKILKLLPILGPGWVVMMADLDSPSIITAAQSGAQYQGHLIVFLLFLAFPLFLVQDTASRIGAVTGKSLGKIITENFGQRWTIFAVASTTVIDFSAYVGEFAGAAAASVLLGIPVIITIIVLLLVHSIILFSGKYNKIEVILVLLSFVLFIFAILDLYVHPERNIISSMNPIVYNKNFIFLMAANLGAVLMPWMLFYHQAADVDRGINLSNMKRETRGTIMGAAVSEILMVSIVIFAWKISESHFDSNNPVGSVGAYLYSIMGPIGPFLFAMGLIVASLLALMVISMSMSYSVSDALKIGGSFNSKYKENRLFYNIYLFEIIPGAIIVLFFNNFIQIALSIMVLNAIVLAFPLIAVIKISSSKSIMGKYAISNLRKGLLYLILIGSIAAGIISFIP